jgi:hypothetical protein
MKNKLILSAKQLENLISISLRNSLDVVSNPTNKGIKFLIILDCLSPEGCISPDLRPETEQEKAKVLECHGVAELSSFLSHILSVKIDGVPTRAVETVPITSRNLGKLLEILDGVCNYWDDLMEEPPLDLTGKNMIEGNGTIQ